MSIKGNASHRENGINGMRSLLPEMPSNNMRSQANLRVGYDSIDEKVSKKLFGSITVQEMMDPNARTDNYGVDGYKLQPGLRFNF
jgi:hypothetical protein